MDLVERIVRRRTRRVENRLVVDRDALNPAVHLPEPVGREGLFKQLLDVLDPLFEESLPPNAYVWGPSGAGKTAIVTTLLSALEQELTDRQPLYTATRAESGRSGFGFAYLDARRARSEFRVYRQLLDELRPEPVPERGLGTDDIRADIESELATTRGVVVAVDHLGEPETVDLEAVHRFFAPFEGVAWIGVGRQPPEDLPLPLPETQVHVPGYTHELVDILTVRGTRGLSRDLDHVHARRIADWADGDAHDALAALFVAALDAEADGVVRLRDEDIEAGVAAVPKDGVSVARVLGLPDNERRVLRELLETSADGDLPVHDAADRIAARTDLTSSTVTRLLYELSQRDVLRRQEVSVGRQVVGRPPSTVTPNFSARLFKGLYGD